MTAADYYATSPGELLGKGFDHLNVDGMRPRDVLHCLAHNLNPETGELLRPHVREGDRVGMDFTFNAPKSVSLAREMAGEGNIGDARVEDAHREAVAYAMKYIERDMQTRVRGGRDGDRVTGNLLAYRVTHRDTRINAEDQKPDPHLHDHVYVLNLTHDPVEGKFKAAQIAEVKHDAPFYEAVYMNRLASNLRELGYGIRRDGKAFEINGVDRGTIDKFSRRTGYIKSVAEKLGITRPETMSKLGATTRLGKAAEMVEDLNGYFVSRLANHEREQLSQLEFQPSYESSNAEAVKFAIDHTFERQSVVEEKKLYETAIRHGIGSVTPDGIQEEAKRQGLIVKGKDASTRDILAEENRIVEFAREGRGTCRPLNTGVGLSTEGYPPAHPTSLSPEQQAMVSHVLRSQDRLLLVIGDAGTGKTRSLHAAFESIHCPSEILAPSAAASRGVLREEGFDKADTVASFLGSTDRQEAVKNGVIWVDEAGLLAIKDLSALTEIAKQQNARLVLQGDPKQHASPARSGDMMNVLQEYAGLPVGRLTEIWRQKHDGYKRVVADIAAGGIGEGFDGLNYLGWVKQVENNGPLVDDYMTGLRSGKQQLVVAPTHAEGDGITADIRTALRSGGKIVFQNGVSVEVPVLQGEDHIVDRLVPLNWTAAERADKGRYAGDEVLCFHRNSGTCKAGQKIAITDWKPGNHYKSVDHFSVHRREQIGIAQGDLIRITANGSTLDKKHKLNNGSVYRVKGFDEHNNLVLDNGWTVAQDFGHIDLGYVSTSHAAQGKTVDRVLIAMGSQSLPAISAEGFYVSVSRARQQAKIFSDLPPEELKRVIQRTDSRKSATEVFRPKPKRKSKKLVSRIRRVYEYLREKTVEVIKSRQHVKENQYER